MKKIIYITFGVLFLLIAIVSFLIIFDIKIIQLENLKFVNYEIDFKPIIFWLFTLILILSLFLSYRFIEAGFSLVKKKEIRDENYLYISLILSVFLAYVLWLADSNESYYLSIGIFYVVILLLFIRDSLMHYVLK